MTLLLSIHSLSKSHGTQVLFNDLSFTVSQGDQIGLLGPNGAGKTSLLEILANVNPPDSGYLSKKQGLRIGYASQSPQFPDLPIEKILIQAGEPGDPIELQSKARILLGKAQFVDFSLKASSLSGGWKKRVDIVRALMNDPDLILLDEPTNHLDLEGIEWLEKLLSKEKLTSIIVSHDRYFLEATSNKIIELNRCYPQGLFISEGTLSDFQKHKNAFLDSQMQHQKGLASIVREETAWLKRSPKARTTKAQSRVKAAHQLIDELSELQKRNQKIRAEIQFTASERETRKLIATQNLSKSIGDRTLFKGINVTLSPGMRLGVVGKNGTGKTTFLKVLAGLLQPDQGTIKYADDLQLVYFDQHREQLNPKDSLKDALSPLGDYVNYRGQSIHVNGWAKKFLFHPDRLSLPVERLSGGERARILIARLMLKPADVLFLDEPTNDLDIPTLEVIESSLRDFPGAVVLITHDRCLMDQLCTHILGLGENREQELFSDYLQWEKAIEQQTSKPISESPSAPPKRTQNTPKLTYKEKIEFEGMEEAIVKAEADLALLAKELEDPTRQTPERYRLLSDASARLELLFARWEELERKLK